MAFQVAAPKGAATLQTARSLLGPRAKKIWSRITTMRRISFTRGGFVFAAGAFTIGFAAFNSGNNLLYLLFGSMLGLIVASGWLSEQVIRELRVVRRVPRGATAGNPLRIQYTVENRKSRIPSFTLEVGERGLGSAGFVPFIAPRSRTTARSEALFEKRGVIGLTAVTISTTFPFGLFKKSRDLPLPGELIIWPRSDREIPPPHPLGARARRSGILSSEAAGPRGEYRGLRSYRPGDDPRDIHWRTSARFGQPLIREYERGTSESLWICLDTRGEPGDPAEALVEVAASLAARAFRRGRRFGLVTPSQIVELGLGPGQLERILGALARVEFDPDAPRLRPPVSPKECVLVSLGADSSPEFGDRYAPPRASSSLSGAST